MCDGSSLGVSQVVEDMVVGKGVGGCSPPKASKEWLTHMAGKPGLAVGRKPLFFTKQTSS